MLADIGARQIVVSSSTLDGVSRVTKGSRNVFLPFSLTSRWRKRGLRDLDSVPSSQSRQSVALSARRSA